MSPFETRRVLALAALLVAACGETPGMYAGPPPEYEAPKQLPTAQATSTSAPMPEDDDIPETPPSAAPAASSSAPSASVPTASASASASAAPVKGKKVKIELTDPKFTTGDVKKAKASVEKQLKKLKACIDDNNGLVEATGTVDVQFLVRAAGVAEGVEVLKAQGIGDAAKKCIAETLKKKSIGTPSEDPVGVTITLKLTPAS
jgi:hypothetical protein